MFAVVRTLLGNLRQEFKRPVQWRSKSTALLTVFTLTLGLTVALPASPASAVSPLTWTTQTPAQDNEWRSVTYGNGIFVAVAKTGTGNRVMTSRDGITWTNPPNPVEDKNWESVTFGNGRFVAVASTGLGFMGSGPNRVMTSLDGITWGISATTVENYWNSVTYGNGLFVAVATNQGLDQIMTSPNGITWTVRAKPAGYQYWQSVTFGNGLFVAVSASISGAGTVVMTSPDGINWTSRTSPAANAWSSVTYGGGLFVVVGKTGTGNRVMTSPDGINWTLRSSAADFNWQSVTYGSGLFVAVSFSGLGNRVMTSPDGINWTLGRSSADNNWVSVAYGNGRFVAVAGTGTRRVMTALYGVPNSTPTITSISPSSSTSQTWITITGTGFAAGASVTVGGAACTNVVVSSATSIRCYSPELTVGDKNVVVTNSDSGRTISTCGFKVTARPPGQALTWTCQKSAADNAWQKVIYANGLFVAVAYNGASDGSARVMTSPDGVIWTPRTAPTGGWSGLTYGNGLFVAVAGSGTTRVMTSPDGITWTSRTAAAMALWRSVTYGNGLFVAVGATYNGKGVMTSPDGITWTLQTTPQTRSDMVSVIYANEVFVAVGCEYTNGCAVMRSSDGITWTYRNTLNSTWFDVTYGNGLFVAVGLATANNVITSPDGITWTYRTAPDSLRAVTYGNGLFVATNQANALSRVLTSPDGITWTFHDPAVNQAWASLTYGNGRFVAVTTSGTGDRVMTADYAAPVVTPTVSASSVSHIFGQSLETVTGTTASEAGATIGAISCGAFVDAGLTTPLTTSTRPGFYFTGCTGPAQTTGTVRTIVYKAGTYQVSKPPATLAYPLLTKEYGETVPFLASSTTSGAYVNSNFTGLVAGDTIDTATTSAWTFSNNANLASANVGANYTYRLNVNQVNYSGSGAATGALNSTYAITESPITGGVMRIIQAPLTVTPAAITPIALGAAVPETFTATYTGWKLGESASTPPLGWNAPLCTAPSVPVDANRLATTAGTYNVLCSGGSASNYSFTYVAGTVVVPPAPAPATIITATNETSTVGSPIASISYTMSNLASGDWIPVGSEFSCDAYDGSNLVTGATKAGTYASKCTGPAFTGLGRDISYVSGTYLVNKAPLTLTALNRNKVYGDLATAGTAANAAVTGLVNGDTVTVSFTYSGGGPLAAGAGGGNYTITPLATLSGGRTLSDYYQVTVNTGIFSVAKAPLRIKADDGWGIQGQLKNNYSADWVPQYFGFKNGETSSSLATPASCLWNAVADGSGVLTTLSGDYTLVCSGAVSGNYDFNYEVAKYPVRPQAIWVKAENGTSVFGSALAGGVSGYGVNATGAYLTEVRDTKRPLISCKAYKTLSPNVELTSADSPGTYVVRCTGPVKTTDNTDILYEDGVYTITKPALTVKANDRTRIYGETFVAGTNGDATITGLIGSDTVTVTYTYGAVQDSATAVGSYTITPVVTLSGGLTLPNYYQVSLVNGVSSVTPFKVTLTPENLTDVKFGSTPPASYSYTLKTMAGSTVPTANIFTVAPTCTSGFNASTPRGTVLDIVCAGGTLLAANYEVEYVQGTLEVEPVPLTVANATAVKTNSTSADPRVNFTARANTGNWVAGCKVSWALNPSAGTGSTYEAYPDSATVGTNRDLVLNASVPYGVYNVTMSLSGNCSGAPTQSVLVVAPNTVGTDSRTIGSGTYTDARTSNTVNFSFEWQKSGSTYTTPFTWTVADKWRINSTLGSQVTLLGMDEISTTTVSTWGRNDCPTGLAGTCSTLIGQVMLQRWVPNWRLVSGGYWVDFGLVSMTMRVAETTSGADQVSMQMRQVPGSRAIPSRVPTSLWVALQSGSIQHLS